MDKLKSLINSQDYSSAYEYLLSSNFIEKPIKFYNLAFLKYEQDKPVEAIYYLEKAKYSGLFSPELNSALLKVKEQLGLNVYEQDYTLLDQLYLSLLSLPFDLVLSVTGIFMLATLFFLYKKRNVGLSVALFFTVAMSGISLHINQKEIMVNQQENLLHQGPSKIFEAPAILPAGVKFIVAKKYKDWSFVDRPLLFRGWVKNMEAKKL